MLKLLTRLIALQLILGLAIDPALAIPENHPVYGSSLPSFSDQAVIPAFLSVLAPKNRLAAQRSKWTAIQQSFHQDFPVVSKVVAKALPILKWIPLPLKASAYQSGALHADIGPVRYWDRSRLFLGLVSLWASTAISLMLVSKMQRFPIFIIGAWGMRMQAAAFVHQLNYGEVRGVKVFRYVIAGVISDIAWFFIKPYIATLFIGHPYAVVFRLLLDTALSYPSLMMFFWLAHRFQGITRAEYSNTRKNLTRKFFTFHIPYWTAINGLLIYGYLWRYPQWIPFVNNFFGFIYSVGLAWLGNSGAAISAPEKASATSAIKPYASLVAASASPRSLIAERVLAAAEKPYKPKDRARLSLPSEISPTNKNLIHAIEKALRDVWPDQARRVFGHPEWADASKIVIEITGSASYLFEPNGHPHWPSMKFHGENIYEIDMILHLPDEWYQTIQNHFYKPHEELFELVLGDAINRHLGADASFQVDIGFAPFKGTLEGSTEYPFHPENWYFGSAKSLTNILKIVNSRPPRLQETYLDNYLKIYEKASNFFQLNMPYADLKAAKRLVQLARLRGDELEAQRLLPLVDVFTNGASSLPGYTSHRQTLLRELQDARPDFTETDIPQLVALSTQKAIPQKKLTISAARESDLPQLLQFRANHFEWEVQYSDPEDMGPELVQLRGKFVEQFQAIVDHRRKGVMLKAFMDGELVGYVQAIDIGSHVALITEGATIHSKRRTGIGERLQLQAIQQLRELGFQAFCAIDASEDRKMGALYEKIGFIKNGMTYSLRDLSTIQKKSAENSFSLQRFNGVPLKELELLPHLLWILSANGIRTIGEFLSAKDKLLRQGIGFGAGRRRSVMRAIARYAHSQRQLPIAQRGAA